LPHLGIPKNHPDDRPRSALEQRGGGGVHGGSRRIDIVHQKYGLGLQRSQHGKGARHIVSALFWPQRNLLPGTPCPLQRVQVRAKTELTSDRSCQERCLVVPALAPPGDVQWGRDHQINFEFPG
jgi:hypothetical protein